MEALIYCRVSTEDQEREGTSLDSQAEACLKLARERGYDVPEEYIFREVWSGADMDRPLLNKARDLIRGKVVDGVIPFSTDRLARNPIHIAIIAEECEKREIELIFVTEPLDNSPEGQLIRYVKGYAAQIEREKIRERTIRGKRERARQGKMPHGGHARLFGYDYIKAKYEGGGVRVINEDAARWVREMFRWLVEEGLSVRDITLRLRSLGIPTPSGNGYWIKSTVHKMLTNPAYIGKTYAFTQSHVPGVKHYKQDRKRKDTHIVFKPPEQWIEIPSATPPIIGEELFNAAQARLRRNKDQARRNTKADYLLRGHVYCSRCGRRFWGQQTGREGKKGSSRGRYYYCPGRWEITSPSKCDNKGYPADWLEEALWEQVERVLSNPELVLSELQRRKQEAQEASLWERDLERIDTQVRNLKKREAQLLRAYLFGYDEELMKREKVALDGERAALEERKLQLERAIEGSRERSLDTEGVDRFCELVRQNLGGFSFEDKRLALEALRIKVCIDGSDVSIEGAIPIQDTSVVSTPSLCNHQSHSPSHYPIQLPPLHRG